MSIAGLIVGLIGLGMLALSTQLGFVNEAKRTDSIARLAAAYQEARFWVGQEESLERKYRLESSPAVLALHDQAEANLTAYLKRVSALDGSPSTTRVLAGLLKDNAEYTQATRWMFAAVIAGNVRQVAFFDRWVTDPIFSALERVVYRRAAVAAGEVLKHSASLRRNESNTFNAGVGALALMIVLVGCLGAVIQRDGRTRKAMRAAELERLGHLAITDPLTGLRNHRAFHGDLAQEIERTGRTGVPMSLVMLDADDLKIVNDKYGHQAGDEQLTALAQALSASPRTTDRTYRIGGDEFAVILQDAGEWAAFEFAQRLRATLTGAGEQGVHATAGIAQALEFRPKDELVHEADLALTTAKRSHQDVVIYSPDIDAFEQPAAEVQDEHHTRTLASALALAVDAKDSYTRSHCQTVSTLCGLIATELGLDPSRVRRIRLAGLLHDVGKIGIPDSILKKPAKLSPAEFEQMKTHSTLGEGIVQAAELPVEARWVRHHHERIDAAGYPDGLSDREIPLESRIIHVADAFEAMTSDRPYRPAPGVEFAIRELQLNAGTQFDSDVVAALLRAIGDRSAADPLMRRDAVLA